MCDTLGNINIPEGLERTAIPSWSGYVYQGKIAVYHALTLLCANKECNYSVQLDYFEDFSILNNIGQIVSLHQVKALARAKWCSYKNHFDKLKTKALKHTCQQAYFHLANGIEDKTVAEIESMYEQVKIYQYKDNLRTCEVGAIDRMVEAEIKHY